MAYQIINITTKEIVSSYTNKARGVINGVLLSIPLWVLIVFVVYEVMK